MTKKHWILITLALGLGGLSLYLNRDWFAGENIQIMSRTLPRRPGFLSRKRANSPAAMPVIFGLDRKLKLTEVKVVALTDLETNKYPHALWHLISDSNSVPLRQFIYGTPIQGMRPEYKGTTAEPLEPGTRYRLTLEAGSLKGQHDFETTQAAP